MGTERQNPEEDQHGHPLSRQDRRLQARLIDKNTPLSLKRFDVKNADFHRRLDAYYHDIGSAPIVPLAKTRSRSLLFDIYLNAVDVVGRLSGRDKMRLF